MKFLSWELELGHSAVNRGKLSERQSRKRVRVRARCKPKSWRSRKALSKQRAVVHRDNGAAAQRAVLPGEHAAPEGEVERQSDHLRG